MVLLTGLNLKWHCRLLPKLFSLTKLFLKLKKFTFEISPLPLFTAPVFVPPPEVEKIAHFIKSLTKPFGTLGIFETFHGFVASFNPPVVLFEAIVAVTPSAMFDFFADYFFDCARITDFLIGGELRWFLSGGKDGLFEKSRRTFERANWGEFAFDELAVIVNCPVEIMMLFIHFYQGFVDFPASCRLTLPFSFEFVRNKRRKFTFPQPQG